MPFDHFLERLRVFAGSLLRDLCRDPDELALATYVNSEKTIFLRAKLSRADFDAIYAKDLQVALSAVFARVGALRTDPNGKPFEVFFQLYDATFEQQFTPVTTASGF